MTDKILLIGAHFFARHGVSDEEQRVGGRYVVDIVLEHGLARAAASDNLADTVSYSEVYRTVREVVEGKSFRLIEALAETIAQTLLARYPAETVWVRVKKQPPPTDGIIDYAGVEITRTNLAKVRSPRKRRGAFDLRKVENK
ncbi:MAG: dihydroneopterin aldolase [Chloroflexota bacterium]|nr:dihydroneopterin aldolase [Chloroflexota bacterium]